MLHGVLHGPSIPIHNKTTAAAKPPKIPAPIPATFPAFEVAVADVAEAVADDLREEIEEAVEAALDAPDDAAPAPDVAVAVVLLDTQETLDARH
ncbi:hypothetical protein BP5796_06059 [Coleophoma crateriformis]|uniref:Uncharacterized protein n=1 Tax=Coleophoma crateriformis TaxID=565419 RepID=A0A3D8RVW6_9HELO|nr:hypothetical protein BP5796_06059 [Coleophoma crateriformis]